MATSSTSKPTSGRPERRSSTRRVSWMSERQLDAYLQTRETLRRLREAAFPPSDVPPHSSPGRAA